MAFDPTVLIGHGGGYGAVRLNSPDGKTTTVEFLREDEAGNMVEDKPTETFGTPYLAWMRAGVELGWVNPDPVLTLALEQQSALSA
jgi:hypothetical protein